MGESVSSSESPIPLCCLKAFQWAGTPSGTETTIPSSSTGLTPIDNKAYVTGTNPKVAIMIIHDVLGWTFANVRLLADHYAREIDATVYVPDFFAGQVLDHNLLLQERFAEVPGLDKFMVANAREVREPEIFACAKALRSNLGYEKVGAVGFCWGGWGVFRLASKEHRLQGGRKLVDAITCGHPGLLTEADVEGVDESVAMQVLAPEHDQWFSDEMKVYAFTTLTQKVKAQVDFQFFPGVTHGCLVRGDENKKGERAAMVRGKNAAVAWMRQWLVT
ncbi:Alpha/Beta hydrolase protein [Apodospora peruviana]|uniref:Alpha/Beta hydrolase protein n=1 Tax=Apodospora peruviana TaxID=516989 RepID=A0AAE0IJK1_9PEZI|nr:Alpha/Beta hydrolase protein [Apodospora peruviana]